MTGPEKSGQHEYPTDPLDRDFETYEDYLLGILNEMPSVPPGLSHNERELLYRKRAFLEWKYEDGLEEARYRHPESYRYLDLIRSLPETEDNTDDTDTDR